MKGRAYLVLTLAHVIATAIVFPLSGAAEDATVNPNEDLHALVVGASRYGPGWPILTSVPDDVKEVTSVLTERGFKVEPPVIDPDIGALRRAFQDFVNNYGYRYENRLLIYFSGHGYSDVASDGRTMGYIVPVDAPKPYGDDKAEFYTKAMNMDEIVFFAKQIRAKHALFVFDSCFSGTIFGVSRSPNDPPGDDLSITYKLREPVRQFITAGDANEPVPGDSLFRKLFVEALRGDESIQQRIGQDGYLTGLELGDYLQRKVIEFSKGETHPRYGTINDPALAKGDFVFRMPKLAIPPPTPMAMTGHLQVNVTAPDTEVKVGGRSVGTASPGKPLNVENLPVGPVKVDVSAEGYEPESKTIQIARSEWTQEVFDLVRKMLRVEGPKPGDVDVVDLGGGVKLELVYVPPDTFQMGSSLSAEETARRYGGEAKYFTDEHPQHEVTISRGFWMGKYEVTNEQWSAFAAASNYKSDAEKAGKAWVIDLDTGKWDEQSGASWRKPGWPVEDRNPVVCISWNDAQAYCTWLSGKTQSTYRLPTEAEWEYACRGGTQTPFPWGTDADAGKGWLNGADTHALPNGSHWNNSFNFDDGYWSVSPAGTYRANHFGLYDMLGNVYEWCGDWYGSDYYEQTTKTDPSGPDTGDTRVLRGGSWFNNPWFCRSALRYGIFPTSSTNYFGFRVVRASPR